MTNKKPENKVIVVENDISGVGQFTKSADAYKAILNGDFGEGTFSVLTVHGTRTVEVQNKPVVTVVESTTYGQRGRKAVDAKPNGLASKTKTVSASA